jgi:hydrogenase nickel incorporation protein HypB
VFSVTEGEDKPIKYPDMFAAADLMLISKADLIPHVDFDIARTIEYARRVNPRIEVLVVSARTGEGMQGFYAWIARRTETADAGAKAAGWRGPRPVSEADAALASPRPVASDF